MSRTFAILGKLLLGAIFLIAILTAGYHVGTSKNVRTRETTSPQMGNTSDIASSPTPTFVLEPTKPIVKKTITGGLSTGTSFQKYSLQVPSDWHEKREIMTGVSEKLTFSKDSYSLTIYQAPMDGRMCLYNDSKPIEGPSQTYTDFVEFKGKESTFRRSFDTTASITQSQTICEKRGESYGSPTQFGAITATISLPENEKLTEELDAILQSIEKR